MRAAEIAALKFAMSLLEDVLRCAKKMSKKIPTDLTPNGGEL